MLLFLLSNCLRPLQPQGPPLKLDMWTSKSVPVWSGPMPACMHELIHVFYAENLALYLQPHQKPANSGGDLRCILTMPTMCCLCVQVDQQHCSCVGIAGNKGFFKLRVGRKLLLYRHISLVSASHLLFLLLSVVLKSLHPSV